MFLFIFFPWKRSSRGINLFKQVTVWHSSLSWLNLGDCNWGHGGWWLQTYGNVFPEIPGKGNAPLSWVFFSMAWESLSDFFIIIIFEFYWLNATKLLPENLKQSQIVAVLSPKRTCLTRILTNSLNVLLKFIETKQCFQVTLGVQCQYLFQKSFSNVCCGEWSE